MKKIEANYHDVMLLPPSIEDWVAKDHPARFIREIVNQIDISGLSNDSTANLTGRPSYSNQLLLRIWLMGYWRGIHSVRKLEQACCESLPFIWLCGNHPPDHTTLWRFFHKNKKHLRAFFKQTVVLAKKLNLIDFVLQAVDGTKIKAVCSSYMRTDKKSLEKLLSRIEERIDEIEKALAESVDNKRVADPSLPKELKDRNRLRQKLSQAIEQLENSNVKHCHPQELDARRMKCNEGNQFAQNAQIVVDSKNQIIVAEDVISDNCDTNCLHKMIESAKENTSEVAQLTLADKGYSSSAQLEKVASSGYNVLAPHQTINSKNEVKPYHSMNFKYDSKADVVICPQGKKLLYYRTRKCENFSIKCYRNKDVCNQCPVRNDCTKSTIGRDIEIRPGREEAFKMHEKLKKPENQDLYRRRCAIVEPVFAQIKSNGKFNRWTMRGLSNVKAQWHILCGVWNLKRIYALWKNFLQKISIVELLLKMNLASQKQYGI